MTAPRGELAAQLALALPLVAHQVGTVVMGVVDTAMLGHYTPDAVAGAGIASGLLFAITCLGIGTVMGLDPLLAQAVGAGHPQRTPAMLNAGVALAVRVGLALTLAVLVAPWLLTAAGVDPDVAASAAVYVSARAIAIVPQLVAVALRAFLQAHGVTWPMWVAAILANLANATLDLLLIFGDDGLAAVGLPPLGIPAMGALGAALATSAVTVATTVVYAAAVRRVVRRLPADHDPPAPAATRRAIAAVGVPIGLQLFAEVAAFALAAVLAGRLGLVPAAAHQIAIQLASVSFAIALGLGATAATRVGLAVGAGDLARARHAARVSLGLGAAVMSTSAVCFVVATAPLARAFADDPAVVATAITLIRIAAVFQLSDGAQAIIAGALRGAGDTRAAFVANLIGHYAIGLPVALIAGFVAAGGAPGLWIGLTAGLTGTAIALAVRLVWLLSRPIARAPIA